MTKEQIKKLEEFALELRCNRDYYSRAKIIQLLVDKVKELNDPNFVKKACEHKYTKYWDEENRVRCIDCNKIIS